MSEFYTRKELKNMGFRPSSRNDDFIELKGPVKVMIPYPQDDKTSVKLVLACLITELSQLDFVADTRVMTVYSNNPEHYDI